MKRRLVFINLRGNDRLFDDECAAGLGRLRGRGNIDPHATHTEMAVSLGNVTQALSAQHRADAGGVSSVM